MTSVATDAGSTSVAPHTSISCHSRRGGGEADTNLSFQVGRLPGRINPHSVVDTFRRSCGPSPSLLNAWLLSSQHFCDRAISTFLVKIVLRYSLHVRFQTVETSLVKHLYQQVDQTSVGWSHFVLSTSLKSRSWICILILLIHGRIRIERTSGAFFTGLLSFFVVPVLSAEYVSLLLVQFTICAGLFEN